MATCKAPESLHGLLRFVALVPRKRSTARPAAFLRRHLHCTAFTLTSNLFVNSNRLMDRLHFTCQWGQGERWGEHATQTGMSRVALSDADKQARDWFVDITRSLGCAVTVDVMGNIFAVRKGKRAGAPTAAGSHLDTQPRGGRYDGILGIHAGVEMLEVLNENAIETEYPVGLVNWTNKAGARFPMSMSSSGVWAGAIALQTAHDLHEVDGPATMRSELERIGYLGLVPASYEANPLGAHFELHIEQGAWLELSKRHIGIVTGAKAYNWYTVEVTGKEAHTGTTPIKMRNDALVGTAKMIVRMKGLSVKTKTLISTGVVEVLPGSVNTIPGCVKFTVDVRAASDLALHRTEQLLRVKFREVACQEGLEIKWTRHSASRAVEFDEMAIRAVRTATHDVLGDMAHVKAADMRSGAGHDSIYVSRRCPTAMIFVPSVAGISHNPREYTRPEDCARGANVLMHSVLAYDRWRAGMDKVNKTTLAK